MYLQKDKFLLYNIVFLFSKSIEDLKNVLQQLGFEAYEQKYQFQNDFIKYKVKKLT